MNKSELLKAIAEKTKMTQKDAGIAFDAALEAITEALSKGEKVQIIRFGSFEVRDRSARTVISPSTKEEINVPATKAPAFKPGKALKDAVVSKPKAKAIGNKKK